jgi:hypothetical protein
MNFSHKLRMLFRRGIEKGWIMGLWVPKYGREE